MCCAPLTYLLNILELAHRSLKSWNQPIKLHLLRLQRTTHETTPQIHSLLFKSTYRWKRAHFVLGLVDRGPCHLGQLHGISHHFDAETPKHTAMNLPITNWNRLGLWNLTYISFLKVEVSWGVLSRLSRRSRMDTRESEDFKKDQRNTLHSPFLLKSWMSLEMFCSA